MSEEQERHTTPARGLKARIAGVWARLRRLRIVRAYLRYSDRRGPSFADGITYRTMFSVFAGLLLGFSLAALWLDGNPEAMHTLQVTLDTMIPGLTAAVDLKSIEAPAAFSIVGIISLIGLVGAAIGAVASLRIALRTLADRRHDDDNFVWLLVRNLLVAIAFGGLLVGAAALSLVSSFGAREVTSWLGYSTTSQFAEITTRVLGILAVFIIDVFAVALAFVTLSGVAAPFRALISGAMLGGVGLLVLQELSGLFVRGATSNPLLASFASLIALLLWFNLAAQVILLSSSYVIVKSEDMRSLRAARNAEGPAK